jgi:hypothetical protein
MEGDLIMVTFDMKISGLHVTIKEPTHTAQVVALSQILDDFWTMLDFDTLTIHWPRVTV